MPWHFARSRRKTPLQQRLLPFYERRARLHRRFKAAILALTVIVSVVLVGASPTGRYAVRSLSVQARKAAEQAIGMPPDRAEIAAEWRLRRERGIEQTRGALQRAYEDAEPAVQRLMDYGGLAPHNALLRWGNYDRTLLLPSTVFEADDTGRSYRLRPNLRSIWVRHITLKQGVLGFFLVPDGPGLDAAVSGSGGVIVEGSNQSTNSWGCRGPEPDTKASLRGLVLGDSFMQGLFIGDDATPPAQLERFLRDRLKQSVSILNTGHLGYSPEQYYHTLVEYEPRFKPQFIVLSVFANDFGDAQNVVDKGTGDWNEAKYWLDQIFQYCRSRYLICLATPVPFELQVVGGRRSRWYPGRFMSIASTGSMSIYNPIEEFIDENLRLTEERRSRGEPVNSSPLFNGQIADGHFSPEGSAVWARAIGARLLLLRERWKLLGMLPR